MDAEENGIYFTFITALSLVAIFLGAYAVSVIKNLRRRHIRYREFALRDAQVIEWERKRISEDLHDDFGSSLASLKLALQSIREQYPHNTLIEQTSLQLEQSTAKLRSISYNLIPKAVEVRGLAGGIAMLVDELNESGTIRIQFISDNDESGFDISTSIIVYRVIQEMLTNTIKHAGATKIKISLVTDGNKLLLQYADNGKGFSIEKTRCSENKNGLRNIFSRLEILGGVHELFTSPGEGIHYKISIPLISMKLKTQYGSDQTNHR